MKKILLIIFLLLGCINVYAQEKRFVGSEFLDGISYMKYDGNTHYYRNAQVIRDTKTNNVAYCVEPFSLLVDDTTYTSFDKYNSSFGISTNNWEKIKLYAYYGYGYAGHTDKKWISITQISIWRVLFPKYQFEWIDDTTSRNIIKPYDKELKELKNLVDYHYKIPKFGGDTFQLKINSSITLEDSGKILNEFKIYSSDFDASIEGNTLVIDSGSEIKSGRILLERSFTNYSNSSLYFYSNSSQNLIERGNAPSYRNEIKIITYSGSVNITKLDSELNEIPQGEASLDGTVFDLFDSNMIYMKSVETIDNKATFTDLSYGKYYIKEATPGRGYYLNDNIYEFEINEENQVAEVVIANNVIKSKVKIIKFYGSKNDYLNNRMKREENVNFNIYDKNNNLVFSSKTDNNGIIECVLPYGDYVLRQIDSTDGYQKNDDYWFSINEDSSYSIEIPLYDFKIEVFNAGIELYDYLKEWFFSLC